MRIVKYMVSILLIAFAALAIAEGYAQYTFSFSTNYQGVVVKETTESNIEHLAEQYDVDFFVKNIGLTIFSRIGSTYIVQKVWNRC